MKNLEIQLDELFEQLPDENWDSVNMKKLIANLDASGIEKFCVITQMSIYECMDLMIKNEMLKKFDQAFFDSYDNKVHRGHLYQILENLKAIRDGI